ncbi:MAG TPA: hypothetical protein PLF10_11055 [Dokdonella sp.]|jgi:hypothetical protein|nr:hypothetical protein [Dokdonella sp.]
MARHVVGAMLLVVAVIHLLPLVGVLGGPRLAALYGITLDDPNLMILMRHRAVLFGLLGGFLAVAAWRPRLQAMALAAGYISVFSFLGLAWLIGESNAQMERVVMADQVAAVCLLIALPVFLISRRKA